MHVIEFFDRGVRVNPHGNAFVAHDGTGAVTYLDAEEMTHRVAGALHREGTEAGTPIAVLSGNSPALMPCVLGVLRAGCAWVALNTRATTDELAGLLTLVHARMLVYSADLGPTARRLVERVSGLRAVCLDAPAPIGLPFRDWLAPAGTRVPLPPAAPEGVAAYFGTGGTTGAPKAVELPHRALETMIHGFNAHMPESEPVHLVAAPLTHAAGTIVLPVLSRGGVNVIHESVDAGKILESIERHRVTRLFLPPTAVYSLLDHPEAATRDTSSLRYFLYGAAPMSVSRLKQALHLFGPVMAQFYGQVEAPMLCTFLSPEEHAEALGDPALEKRLRSCGRTSLIANVQVMEGDRILGPGEIGEIVVRSSLVMRGYHRSAALTADTRRPGGWHATGDIGRIDKDGYVYLLDRRRDLIISGGFNVFPAEVEQVLWQHPAVADCAVVGLPDDKWGERVAAFVELKEGADIGAEDLISVCRERVGSVKAPKEIVFRALPRSAAGKVLKRRLREEYWQATGRLI